MEDGLATRVELLRGLKPGPEVVGAALAQQRDRMRRTFREFDDGQWRTTSRCSAWTVHDVVRHLVDASHIDCARLRREPPRFEIGTSIDPRNDPLRWLEASEGQTPSQTMAAFETAIEAERSAIERCIRAGDDLLVDGPYAPLHWSVLATHVFWDAWLHERDIASPLGLPHDATRAEDRLAALYGLAVAAVPPTFTGTTVDVAIELTGSAPGVYEIAASPDSTSVTATDATSPAQVTADLRHLLDALSGRGDDVATVVHGSSDAIEPLTWLRSLLLPAG
jgi:uncharacterized protein (TIGR03083 family)